MQVSVNMKDHLRLWLHDCDLSVQIKDSGIVDKLSIDLSRSRDIVIGDLIITMFEEGSNGEAG